MSPNVKESDSGDDLPDQVASQLRMIEVMHDLTLTNLTSIAKIIIANVKNKSQALQVCTAINTWIAINGMQGNVTVPEPLVRRYVRKVTS
ncbi:MAG: hypothetical protein ACLPI9_05970 [Halobacteriota archaeon]|jgi:hypothetical protein